MIPVSLSHSRGTLPLDFICRCRSARWICHLQGPQPFIVFHVEVGFVDDIFFLILGILYIIRSIAWVDDLFMFFVSERVALRFLEFSFCNFGYFVYILRYVVWLYDLLQCFVSGHFALRFLGNLCTSLEAGICSK
ncbi:hypothetical protein DVH24_030616 [Malus domestica]|uniref:Uncharacterized protein n=1 Tax=Malus domestica TaxID=3750 RepID=A0A498JY27_MALDO|nr:hypothetical protein DVH24_030616 [Malus domestica]